MQIAASSRKDGVNMQETTLGTTRENVAETALDAVLGQLQAQPADAQAFQLLLDISARREAQASDQRRRQGALLGPLDGALVSVKDILDVAGAPTLAGSMLRASVPVAQEDALVVARLRAAGAVIIGKTVLDEFCFTSDGINPYFGTPGNAHDRNRIPGGSSSGAGVAVARGLCRIGIGSDTGGSVRIPAALNGVVGFKPTAKRVPLAGAFALSPLLDSLGPLARSVEDCAYADAIMAGIPARPLDDIGLKDCRLALPPASLMADLDPKIAQSFDHALTHLKTQGVQLIACPIEDLLAQMLVVTEDASFAAIEAARIHADWLFQPDAVARSRIALSLQRRINYPDWLFQNMVTQRKALIASMEARLAGVDAMILPSLPILAPKIAQIKEDPAFALWAEGLLLRNQQIANQFDLTAITLPLPAAGLPRGLMLMARHGEDRALLARAKAVERGLA